MPGGVIIAGVVLIAVVLAMASGAAVVLAWLARRRERLALAAARAAMTRAALAETALHDLRTRRSGAVAKGNRTRAARQAELRKARLAELREAVALKRAGGQHSLPFDGGTARDNDRQVGFDGPGNDVWFNTGVGDCRTSPHPTLPPEGGRAL